MSDPNKTVRWYDDCVKELREAAQVTADEDSRSWFISIADCLEAETPVRALDEVMLVAWKELKAEGGRSDESEERTSAP